MESFYILVNLCNWLCKQNCSSPLVENYIFLFQVVELPRLPVFLADAIKEKANLSQLENEEILKMFFVSMSPSERCPYYLHHFEKTNTIELEWFNYYKEKPEEFEDQCNVYKLNTFRDFKFNC
ncbi:Protein of unknown function [Gryllus bimaculatus]|nr:Protein of unknown function [Gryllus bimaculatus]